MQESGKGYGDMVQGSMKGEKISAARSDRAVEFLSSICFGRRATEVSRAFAQLISEQVLYSWHVYS